MTKRDGPDGIVIAALIVLVALGIAMFGLAVDWPPLETLWPR